MNVLDFMESESEDRDSVRQSSAGKQTTTTATEGSSRLKTKTIKKKYEPFTEGGKLFKYEDDPDQYRRMKKKVQNRESATRVRGRKKDTIQFLQHQNDKLRNINSQLTLLNARLATQNTSLRDQLEFMKNLVQRQNPIKEDIDTYIAQEALINDNSIQKNSQENSPFLEMDFWGRVQEKRPKKNILTTLLIMTIVLMVFVLPNGESTGSLGLNVAQQSSITQLTQGQVNWGYYMANISALLRTGLRYVFILGYIWILFKMGSAWYHMKKFKRN